MTEFQKYIHNYLGLIPSSDWIQEMKNSGDETLELTETFQKNSLILLMPKENGH